ncbi:MAG TPA: undecaprenyl-diphosphate phosphatase [Candidatus Nitrosotalea sp.]|nr:undecaprenyl-diphosphate phosphatase [Candidatus Nitrosotalea sp.]
MSLAQTLFLGLLQGASELFPVSSLGHAVIVPSLLRWTFKQSDPRYVPFLTLLHLGTASALLFLYRRDWWVISRAFIRSAVRGQIRDADERTAMLLVAATVPAGAVGFVLEHPLKALFASPRAAAAFLILNGFMLLGAELLRRRSERAGADRAAQEADYKAAGQLTFRAAVVVGLAQALALLPGMSRSGVTMSGGLLAGLRHQEAARFSFLLATPIIAAAGLLEVPQLVGSRAPWGSYLAAALLAALAAYLSARFLIRYFRSGRLDPYGWYSILAGAVALVLLR